jgi:hypothetical protein
LPAGRAGSDIAQYLRRAGCTVPASHRSIDVAQWRACRETVSGAYGYRRPGDASSAEEPGRDLPKMIAIIGFAVCGLLA